MHCRFSLGTSEMNTVCEKCAEGFFSSSSSALDSCVKHQECPSGQIVLLSGSVYQDTVCGTCADRGERFVLCSRDFPSLELCG